MNKQFYVVLPFVVAIIKNDKGEILLGQQPNLARKPYPLRWDLPGGKIQKFETPEECIKREIKEETGYDVLALELYKVFHHYGDDPNCTSTTPALGMCYNATVSGDFNPTEMENMHWVSVDEIKTLKLTPWSATFLCDVLDL